MVKIPHQKSAAQLILIGMVISLYDVLFDIFVSVIHSSFEWLEYSLDRTIEFFFETTRHDTQVIVFYILMLFVCYEGYRFWKALPCMCQRCRSKLVDGWTRKHDHFVAYWHDCSLTAKLKLIMFYSFLIMLIYLLVF